MRKNVWVWAASMPVLALVGCSGLPLKAPETSLTTPAQQTGYAAGYNYGAAVKSLGASVDSTAVEAGLHDSLSGAAARIDAAHRHALVDALNKEAAAQRAAAMAELAKNNLAASQSFLHQIAQRKDVLTTSSGLLYRAIKRGTGPVLKPDDQVTIAYRAMLADGKVFAETTKATGPLTISAKDGSPGFSEGLQLMQDGGIAVIYLPPHLAFGTRGLPGAVGPNEAVVYEVQMLKVERAKHHDKH